MPNRRHNRARCHCHQCYQRVRGDFVTYAQEAERLGAAVCFVAEAWGTDAVSPLAYLAAKTERIVLASGIMQISARTPAMTAQTALTLAMLSGNRFILGLGISGPQVVEGLHGQPFANPWAACARLLPSFARRLLANLSALPAATLRCHAPVEKARHYGSACP